MKQLIANSGLLIFIIAIVLLVYGLFQNSIDNSILLISGVLIVIGLVVHVIAGKKLM